MSIGQYVPLWDSWYVDEELGEGRSGKVYKVHKTCYAAVKVISIPQSEDEIARASLEMNEHAMRTYFSMFVSNIVQAIDIMNAFKGCPNVVAIEDHKVIQRDALHWDILLRMELMKPLYDYLAEHAFTAEYIIKMGIDISRALEMCAEKGIIHRDVKPDNIFVSEAGDFKLDVFGSCIREHSSGIFRKSSRLYMAPEVYMNKRDYGPAVDLYSLGIVMYRYLNHNRIPFMPPFPEIKTSQNLEEAFMRRMKGEEPLPNILDIEPALNAFILKACAYRPEERYQTAEEFRAALERVRDIQKVE